MYRNWGKRVLDLAVAIPLLIVLSPLLLLVGVIIKMSSTGPIFFRQCRAGYQGETFDILKFRTMMHRERTDHQEIKDANVEVTSIGRILRRLKIDELPQLLNIVIGQMSLVGPRPDLPESHNRYTAAGRKRQLVRPGLTGWAQTHGNIHLSWPERWEYDAKYVEQLSLGLDLRLLARTVLIVILGEKRFFRKPSA